MLKKIKMLYYIITVLHVINKIYRNSCKYAKIFGFHGSHGSQFLRYWDV